MSNTAISVQNVSKRYLIGTPHSDTFRDFLSGIFTNKASKTEEFWALDDVSFDVKQGHVYGIIGKNGAGKSTMLKLISRITYPTSGSIQMHGKVASLLEVGTGFHPELTGRENIFMNGAILGMDRAEIKRRFDEIVAFSGVNKFLDTPVKHYSSGMYVRLAFSVAAHLDPEILIIDEVLAVGDAEFQKKCLGRMKTVSEEGRTVVFVSHNLEAVRALCERVIVLHKGKRIFDGETQPGIEHYIGHSVKNKGSLRWDAEGSHENSEAKIHRVEIVSAHPKGRIEIDEPITLEFEFENKESQAHLYDITFHIQSVSGVLLFHASTVYTEQSQTLNQGERLIARCTIPPFLLNEGGFFISKLILLKNRSLIAMEIRDCFRFDVHQNPESIFGLKGRHEGLIRPLLNWETESEGGRLA